MQCEVVNSIHHVSSMYTVYRNTYSTKAVNANDLLQIIKLTLFLHEVFTSHCHDTCSEFIRTYFSLEPIVVVKNLVGFFSPEVFMCISRCLRIANVLLQVILYVSIQPFERKGVTNIHTHSNFGIHKMPRRSSGQQVRLQIQPWV